MRSDSLRRNSLAALAAVIALAVVLGFSAYGADKKAAPGSVFVADKGKFNILLDGASIGREDFEIEPSGGNWTAKGSTSMKTPDGKSSKVTGTLTLQPDGAPLSYDWAAQTDKNNSAHIIFVNGVAKTTLQMQGAAPYNQDNSFSSPLIAVLDNNLYHQFELLAHIYDWGKKGAQTFPVLIPQELTPGTIAVEFTGTASAGGKSYEGLKATTSDIEILLYLDSAHRLIRLEVPSAKVAVVRE
ncbi:MAG TPA: hypothetical protein VK805_06755 [Candidatus Baltobacteraceae bacterium]|nr:hypothetical protein [Candidatus Baltobacteraceae bacterium]